MNHKDRVTEEDRVWFSKLPTDRRLRLRRAKLTEYLETGDDLVATNMNAGERIMFHARINAGLRVASKDANKQGKVMYSLVMQSEVGFRFRYPLFMRPLAPAKLDAMTDCEITRLLLRCVMLPPHVTGFIFDNVECEEDYA